NALGDSGIQKSCRAPASDAARLVRPVPRKDGTSEGSAPVLANSTHSTSAAIRMPAPPRRRYRAAAFTGLGGAIVLSDIQTLTPETRVVLVTPAPRAGSMPS